MLFKPTRLKGAYLIKPDPVSDERGYFMRTFCLSEFARNGLEVAYLQHNVSYTRLKGTMRGMHFQRPPHAETKVVTCLKGSIHDVIVDLRPASKTYLEWQAFELSHKNRHHLYVPKGFAHGFQSLTDDVEVGYLISEFYEPNAATGVRYDDPALAIRWPLPVSVISLKDRRWPRIKVPPVAAEPPPDCGRPHRVATSGRASAGELPQFHNGAAFLRPTATERNVHPAKPLVKQPKKPKSLKKPARLRAVGRAR